MKLKFLVLISLLFILTACSASPTPDPVTIPPTVPPLQDLIPEKLLDYTLNQELSRPTASRLIYVNPQSEQVVLQIAVRISVNMAQRGYGADGNIVVNDVPDMITPNIYAFNGAYSVYFNKYHFLFESLIEGQDKIEDSAKREKVIAFAMALSDYLANK